MLGDPVGVRGDAGFGRSGRQLRKNPADAVRVFGDARLGLG